MNTDEQAQLRALRAKQAKIAIAAVVALVAFAFMSPLGFIITLGACVALAISYWLKEFVLDFGLNSNVPPVSLAIVIMCFVAFNVSLPYHIFFGGMYVVSMTYLISAVAYGLSYFLLFRHIKNLYDNWVHRGNIFDYSDDK